MLSADTHTHTQIPIEWKDKNTKKRKLCDKLFIHIFSIWITYALSMRIVYIVWEYEFFQWNNFSVYYLAVHLIYPTIWRFFFSLLLGRKVLLRYMFLLDFFKIKIKKKTVHKHTSQQRLHSLEFYVHGSIFICYTFFSIILVIPFYSRNLLFKLAVIISTWILFLFLCCFLPIRSFDKKFNFFFKNKMVSHVILKMNSSDWQNAELFYIFTLLFNNCIEYVCKLEKKKIWR